MRATGIPGLLLAFLLAAGCSSAPACSPPQGYAYDPLQCGGNPWDPPESQAPPEAELAAVRAHYEARGLELGRLERAEVRDAVPAVCGAPRTDRLHATVATGDPALLLADGWFEEAFPAEDFGCPV